MLKYLTEIMDPVISSRSFLIMIGCLERSDIDNRSGVPKVNTEALKASICSVFLITQAVIEDS